MAAWADTPCVVSCCLRCGERAIIKINHLLKKKVLFQPNAENQKHSPQQPPIVSTLHSHNPTTMSSNNNKQQRVVEDAPIYRSVQIQSAQVAPPAMPLGRTTVGPSNKVSSTSKINTSNSTVIRSSAATTLTTSKPAWKVSQLRPVPSFYRLERTHLKIGDATCEEITSRITACLKEESVSATFYNDEVRSIQ